MNDRELIWEAYLQINEVSQNYIDEVKEAVANNELPFNNIFGNKLRIWIPVSGTQTYKEMMEVIKTIPDFDRFDSKTREVVQKREVEAKYGGGVRERRINLGRAISSIKMPEDKKKKFLDWFATYNDSMEDMDKLKDYAIVISRSPIDILRMSDVGSITSCHSETGSYFSCAIQEAKTGGPVAFLVKKSDLDNLGEDEFQDEEIFEDPSRHIKGIVALSRIRIRRYIDKENDEEIAVPEVRVYGNKNLSGFYNSLKDFFMNKQRGLDLELMKKGFKDKTLLRKGGTYTDSSDSHLFNKLFGSEEFVGNLQHDEEDSEEEIVDRATQFEEELRGFHNRYASDIKNFSIGYNVDGDDDYTYYSAYASLKIDPDEYGLELTDDYFEDIDSYTLRSIMSYKEGVKYYDRIPSGYKNDDNFRKIKRFIDTLTSMDSFFEDDMGSLYYGRDGNIYVQVGFGEDDSDTSHDTDDYHSFCNKISSLDDEADKLKKLYIKALRISGYIKLDEDEEIMDEEEFADSLKNLSYEDNTIGFNDAQYILSINRNLDDTTNTGFDENGLKLSKLNSLLPKLVSGFLKRYLNKFYKKKVVSRDDNQLKFNDFYESIMNNIDKELEEYGISDVSAYVMGKKEFDRYNLSATFGFDIDYLGKDRVDVIKFLDDHIDDIRNYLSYVARDIYDIEDNITMGLRKTYGRI